MPFYENHNTYNEIKKYYINFYRHRKIKYINEYII